MLSMMAQGFFSQSSLLILPLVALFIFMAVFTLITIRTLRADAEAIQAAASLPLAEEQHVQKDAGAKQ